MNISDLMHEANSTATEKGWWEKDKPFSESIALMHSELSEALEEWRKFGLNRDALLYTKVGANNWTREHVFTFRDGDKPEGIAAELADVLIRIFDVSQQHNIPLIEAIRVKMAFNKTRSHRHGNKLA